MHGRWMSWPALLALLIASTTLGGCLGDQTSAILTTVGGPVAVVQEAEAVSADATCDATGIHVSWGREPVVEQPDVSVEVYGPGAVRAGGLEPSVGTLDVPVEGGGRHVLFVTAGGVAVRREVNCPGAPRPAPFTVRLQCVPTFAATYRFAPAARDGEAAVRVLSVDPQRGEWGSGSAWFAAGDTTVTNDFGDRPEAGAYTVIATIGDAAVVVPFGCP